MFSFSTANRVVFGRGVITSLVSELGATCKRRGVSETGLRVLVVTGGGEARAARALEYLGPLAERALPVRVSGEPSTRVVTEAVSVARAHGVNAVIGIGGGSAIDAGKAIAALLANQGDPFDYLEVVGKGLPLLQRSAPFLAVPTTAGTGAEVTKNAVLASEEHRVKVSLRSDYMLPDVALVDPELTYSVPAEVTAATGLDAITQVLEPYVSCQANPLTDALCLAGLERGARSVLRAYRDGQDADAREDMALTSLFGGLALANSKLGAVHGFAGPLGGSLGAAHGALCARLLPAVVRVNLAALRQRCPDSPALARYQRVAQMLTGASTAPPEAVAEWAETVCEELQIPRLGPMGLEESGIDVACANAARASSMQGNPVVLTQSELRAILEQAL